MNDEPSAFDVTEELISQSFAFVRAFDQSRNIGNDERFVFFDEDDSKVRR